MTVQGDVQLKGAEDHTFTLKAPPGPALLHVSHFGDDAPDLQVLDKVPEWVDAKDTELMAKAKLSLKVFRQIVEKSSINDALLQFSQGNDEAIRRMALILLGGLDELETLGKAMMATKHPDVIDNAIIVLRHWIGRGPGQDMKLYHALMEKVKYKPAEAELALQLLHSFSRDELTKPEIYETLINFLESERPLIRGLAHWHLIRLVPKGRTIEFLATAPKEDREKAVKQWHELIPEGTVPGHSKEKKEK
jgi:hypothetical protein